MRLLSVLRMLTAATGIFSLPAYASIYDITLHNTTFVDGATILDGSHFVVDTGAGTVTDVLLSTTVGTRTTNGFLFGGSLYRYESGGSYLQPHFEPSDDNRYQVPVEFSLAFIPYAGIPANGTTAFSAEMLYLFFVATPNGLALVADPHSYEEFGAGGYRNIVSGTVDVAGAAASPNAVPEPQTYALFFAGLCTAGLVTRRRNPSSSRKRST